MASMSVSPLRVGGQVGTTIALGLLFDTLVVTLEVALAVVALLALLQVIAAGAHTPPAAFVAAQRLEEAPFLGDTWF